MSDPVVRIRIVSIVCIIFALFLATKLYLVQIVSGKQFSERADRQYIQPVGGVFDRGTIFFQSKDTTLMAAASLRLGYTIAINPKLIKNPEDAYAKLSAVIKLDHADFIARATKQNDSYEEIAKRTDPDIAKAVNALSISGVNTYEEKWRYYPGQQLAAQLLGFVGFNKDGTTVSGQYGLEKQYESTLTRTGDDVYVNFFAEIFSDIHQTLTDTGKTEGDIVSTIEPSVQAALEKQLQVVQDQYRSVITGGIVIDPNTGEIYAMAANPSFDPNTFQQTKNIASFTDPLVQSIYEMGSIVKPLTLAAGLDTGAITPDSTYNDTGCIKLNKSTICNYDLKARGPSTPMQTILNESLNLGAAYVEGKTGNGVFADYFLNKYGLGEKTGIDLPNEASPLMNNLKSPRDVEYATASFGQGIAESPVAIARALSVLANGGKLITPHVVKEIDYNVGFSRKITEPAPLQVLKPETSHEISKMLTGVVDNALLVGAVKMDHYSVAAKTGTAQIVDPSTGKYYPNQYLHSFFGYFPSYNPRFLVFLYTLKPQGVEYASHTLTEPFVNIEKFLINYYEIPPDR